MAGHLTAEERDRIARLWHQQADQKEIARAVGRSPSTISRELRRNRTGHEYYASQSHRQAQRRRHERPLVRKMDDPQINQAVRQGLAQEWAPAQIAGRMKQQDCDRSVSPPTIYAWIKQDVSASTGNRCCGVAANALIAGKTRPPRVLPLASAIVRK